jgi:inward rectifier potassium channel
MLNMPTWKFYGSLFAFYVSVNFLFACIYFIIGRFNSGILAVTPWKLLKKFFSTETYTTVGYGRVNPIGDMANSVAAVESMLGFLSLPLLPVSYTEGSQNQGFLLFSKMPL